MSNRNLYRNISGALRTKMSLVSWFYGRNWQNITLVIPFSILVNSGSAPLSIQESFITNFCIIKFARIFEF